METGLWASWLMLLLGACISSSTLVFSTGRQLREKIGWILGLIGCLSGAVAGLDLMFSGGQFNFSSAWYLPIGSFTLQAGPTEGLMLFMLNLMGGLVVLAKPWRDESSETVAYLVLIFALGLCLIARDVILFLMAWELMALTGVVFLRKRGVSEDHKDGNGLWAYLVSAHLATLCLFILLPTLAIKSGHPIEAGRPILWGVSFTKVQESNWVWVYVALAIAGFGTKAGVAPFHAWVRTVYRNGPAWFGSASSGLMAKVSLYLMLRTLIELVPALGKDRLSYLGGIIMLLGMASGLLGLGGALSSARIRVVLGYSSVENVGIILIGFGLGLWGIARESWAVAFFGFCGAWFHLINHMVTKTLLFLATASVANGTGTDDLARLGGLLKHMPVTGRAFGFGAMSLAAIVPLNSFCSELLIYNGLFWSVMTLGTFGRNLAILAVMVLGLIGGLAMVCFTGVWGLGFLGNSRSPNSNNSGEAHLGLIGKLVLNIFSGMMLLLGIVPYVGINLVWSPVSELLVRFGCPVDVINASYFRASYLYGNLTIVSFLTIVLVVLLKLWRDSRLAQAKVNEGMTWDCGFGYVDGFTKGQYSGLSYFEPLLPFVSRLNWIKINRPDLTAPFPAPARIKVESTDGLIFKLYDPIFRSIGGQLSKLRWIQAGSIQLYLAMLALTLISMLVWIIVF